MFRRSSDEFVDDCAVDLLKAVVRLIEMVKRSTCDRTSGRMALCSHESVRNLIDHGKRASGQKIGVGWAKTDDIDTRQ